MRCNLRLTWNTRAHTIREKDACAYLGARTMETGTGPIHRRSERINVRLPVTLCVDDPETAKHIASTIDLSGYGARLHTGASLVPGQSIAMIADEGSGSSISGRVVWVGPIGSPLDGQAGIEFLSPLPVPS